MVDVIERTADKVVIERLAANDEDDSLEFCMSDESVDRIGDVIEAAGWKLSRFKKNPIALYGHDKYSPPIGRWENVRIEGSRLLGRLKLAAQGTSPFIDALRSLVAQKMIRAVSVGFKPLVKEKLDAKSDEFWGPFRFKSQELLECSLVAVPANANALALRSFSPEVRAMLLAKPGNEAVTRSLGPTSQARRTATENGRTTMPLAERIQSTQDELIALLDAQTPLAKKLEAGEELNEEEEAENTRIDTEKALLEKRLNTLRSAERTLAGGATAGSRPNGNGGFTPNAPAIIQRDGRVSFERGIINDKARPADILVRLGVVHLKAFHQRRPLDQVAKEVYPERTDVDAVFKAVTNPAVTTVAGWAAELVDTAILDFLDALLPISCYAQLRNMGIRFSFGRNGQIRIPRRNRPRNAPGDLRGAFVGEGQPIPVRRGSFGSLTLIPHKMGVISTFSREMAQQSTPQIEGIIREGMVEDTADAVDQALIDAVAGDVIRPAGLLNGVTPIAGSAAATTVEKITADVSAALAPFITANAADGLAWLMNPGTAFKASWASTTVGTYPFRDQLAAGNLAGYPVIQSTNVAATKLILVRARDFVSSTDDTPEFDVSDVATIHEEDGGYPADQAMRPGTTTVLPITSDPAGIPPLTTVVADPVRSLWQTASIGIRMLLGMDWAMRRAGMVQVVDPIAW